MAGSGSPKDRLVTPTFLTSWLVSFSQALLFYLLVTTIALYAVREFAVGEAASGLAASSFVIGATVARVFCGYVVDVLGRRPVLLGASALVVLSCLLYLPIDSFVLLVIVRGLHGFAYAFATTAVMAIAQSVIPASRRAEGTGYFALSTTMATAVGPAIGIFLVQSFDYRTLFVVSLLTSVVALLAAVALRAEDVRTPAAHFRLSDVAHPAVIPVGVFMMLVGLCYGGIITYLNAYAVERDVTVGAGVFFVVYAAVIVVMRFVLGRVQDRYGDAIVIGIGVVSFFAALALLAVATEDWMVVAAGVLTGLGYGTLMPACQAITVRRVEPERLGTGISTMFLFLDVGLGLGPVLLGMIVTATGYGTMYATLAGVCVLAGLFYVLIRGRRARG